MQSMMVKSGNRYRKATAAEVAEVAGTYALQAMNRARPRMGDPAEAVAEFVKVFTGRDYEAFAVAMLDGRHRLIECVELFRGTVDRSSVHPREVAKEVLWRGASAVVLAHNHPSGIALPSEADLMITRRLREALALLDVRILDHLIIGGTGQWYSMANHGEI